MYISYQSCMAQHICHVLSDGSYFVQSLVNLPGPAGNSAPVCRCSALYCWKIQIPNCHCKTWTFYGTFLFYGFPISVLESVLRWNSNVLKQFTCVCTFSQQRSFCWIHFLYLFLLCRITPILNLNWSTVEQSYIFFFQGESKKGLFCKNVPRNIPLHSENRTLVRENGTPVHAKDLHQIE